MDFRINRIAKIRRALTMRAGLRLAAERAPQARDFAASWIEKRRPALARIYAMRTKMATAAVAIPAILLFVHVMFGANGMVVYRQKKTEYESLQEKIRIERKENDRYAQRIQSLKTDEKAIEKEAREQLRYARPGEYVFVPAPVPAPVPPPSHAANR